jgi:hypothetical protein
MSASPDQKDYAMVKRRKHEEIVGVLEFEGRTSEDPDIVTWLADHKAQNGGKIRVATAAPACAWRSARKPTWHCGKRGLNTHSSQTSLPARHPSFDSRAASPRRLTRRFERLANNRRTSQPHKTGRTEGPDREACAEGDRSKS